MGPKPPLCPSSVAHRRCFPGLQATGAAVLHENLGPLTGGLALGDWSVYIYTYVYKNQDVDIDINVEIEIQI